MGALPTPPVKLEWKEMRKAFKDLKVDNEPKTFKFEIVCPYPFERSFIAIPFPKNFEIPKFNKFKGKGAHITHVKEFYMHYQKVTYSDMFLMQLFSKSLGGPTLEWFYHIPNSIVNNFLKLFKIVEVDESTTQ